MSPAARNVGSGFAYVGSGFSRIGRAALLLGVLLGGGAASAWHGAGLESRDPGLHAARAVLPAQPTGTPSSPDEWRTFEGTWSAAGSRRVVPTEDDRWAAVVELAGTIVVVNGEGLARGFLAEAIGFDDGRTVSVGRAVWTDDQGDRIYSRMEGEPLETGRRIVGTITGGTGRYAGLSGEYAFTWQYVTEAEAGRIQGRTKGLAGKVRFGKARP
jgi:hypothetical protein